jgi:hypothetical protein
MEGGINSAGSVSGISLPFRAAEKTYQLSSYCHRLRDVLTSIYESHGDMEFRQVELSSVINVRQIPVPKKRQALAIDPQPHLQTSCQIVTHQIFIRSSLPNPD